MGIQTLPPETCTHIDTQSQLCTVSPPPAPRCAHPRRPAAAKENRKLPGAGAGEEAGAGSRGGGAAAGEDPAPPARPPSALTVDARLVRHGSVPRSARALGALGSALAPLRRFGPGGGGGCGGGRPASLSFPGGVARPAPRAPRPHGRGRGAGTRAARARTCACVWRSRWRACGGACVGDCARVSVCASGSAWSVAGAGSCVRERESVRPRPGGVGSRVAGRARAPLHGRRGGLRVDGVASLAPETFPERLTLGAQADLPGHQPAECGGPLGGGEIGVETWGSAWQRGGGRFPRGNCVCKGPGAEGGPELGESEALPGSRGTGSAPSSPAFAGIRPAAPGQSTRRGRQAP
ncbi:uncharacterized protein LOC111742740 [Pteropus vampyrus]|uniref:Uncharacterized protein LOC111742740 n=1 Tax=Pteropus vampyrus TaxID=132908 RepID=A0A6P6CNH3_PTEVA|nr:uncharacterized protein LOC111742740 [Pteropus vampyrus]